MIALLLFLALLIPTGDVPQLVKEGKVLVLDVRTPAEIEEFGTPEGSLCIPIDELEGRLAEVPRDKPILTACQAGKRAQRAATLLEAHGYTVYGYCGLKP